MSIRIAIAEDDANIRRRLGSLIATQSDMELVCECSCGRELVDSLDKYEVDVILSDVEMESQQDGILAVKQILLFYPHVRAIFLSVHDEDSTILDAFEANAVDYLLKSAAPNDILSSIRKAYQNCSPISSFAAEKLRSEFHRLRQNEASLLYFLNIVFMLTPSERQIIQLLLDGYKVREIAAKRSVEVGTIKSQITTFLKKFGVSRSSEILDNLRKLNMEALFRNLPTDH